MSTNLLAAALVLSLAPIHGFAAVDLNADLSDAPPEASEELPMNDESLAIIQQFDLDYDQWLATDASKKIDKAEKSKSVKVVIRKSSQTMSVSVNGEHKFTTMVSTGMRGHVTPNMATRAKNIERVHMSRKYHAPLPYAIQINGDYFIHAATEGAMYYMKKKVPHSHGCVRVPPVYARQLYDYVRTAGLGNTSITVM